MAHTSLDPHVEVLREFRDKYLISDFRLQILDCKIEIPNVIGKAFVAFYYKVSPPIAEFISHHEALRTVTRFALTPVVYGLKYPIFVWISIVIFGYYIFVFRRKRK